MIRIRRGIKDDDRKRHFYDYSIPAVIAGILTLFFRFIKFTQASSRRISQCLGSFLPHRASRYTELRAYRALRALRDLTATEPQGNLKGAKRIASSSHQPP